MRPSGSSIASVAVPDRVPSAGVIARVGRGASAWLARRYGMLAPDATIPSSVVRRPFTQEELVARRNRLARTSATAPTHRFAR